MTDPVVLDYLRSIDHSLARIADALEALARCADERTTVRGERREEALHG